MITNAHIYQEQLTIPHIYNARVDYISFMNVFLGINTNHPTSPLQVSGLGEYLDNSASLAAGLYTGAFYRLPGDPACLCVASGGDDDPVPSIDYINITKCYVGVNVAKPRSVLHVPNIPVYADNAAALAAGKTAGAFYRTGADPDPLCVVTPGVSGPVVDTDDFKCFRDCYVGIGTRKPATYLHVYQLPVYTSNSAAVLTGKTAGVIYRNGGSPDRVFIVH